MINVITFNYGKDELISNTYILIDKNKDCLVIDPGKDYSGILEYINKNKLNLKGVLLTHGHYDHIKGVDILIDSLKTNLYCYYDEIPMLTSNYLNCSKFMGEDISIKSAPTALVDKEVIKGLLDEDIKVIHTPFHTKGSVCYYLKKSKLLFSGDTLFRYTIGRSDLPTSTPETIYASLKKLKDLPNDVKVYPGHGDPTTIGFEKTNNKHLI
jgi:glyoxylase-like metal-dependent hydrolase (beta-lactamase superfamily II)